MSETGSSWCTVSLELGPSARSSSLSWRAVAFAGHSHVSRGGVPGPKRWLVQLLQNGDGEAEMRMWAAHEACCVLVTAFLDCLGPTEGALRRTSVARILCAVPLGQGLHPRCHGPSQGAWGWSWSLQKRGWGKGCLLPPGDQ